MLQTRLALSKTKDFYQAAIDAGVSRDALRRTLFYSVVVPVAGSAGAGLIWKSMFGGK